MTKQLGTIAALVTSALLMACAANAQDTAPEVASESPALTAADSDSASDASGANRQISVGEAAPVEAACVCPCKILVCPPGGGPNDCAFVSC